MRITGEPHALKMTQPKIASPQFTATIEMAETAPSVKANPALLRQYYLPSSQALRSALRFGEGTSVEFGVDREMLTPGFAQFLDRVSQKHKTVTLQILLTEGLADPAYREEVKKAFIEDLKVSPKSLLQALDAEPTLASETGTSDGLLDGYLIKQLNYAYGNAQVLHEAQTTQATANNQPPPEPPRLGIRELMQLYFWDLDKPVEQRYKNQEGSSIPAPDPKMTALLPKISYAYFKDGILMPSALDNWTTDLTLASELADTQPVVGRDKEYFALVDSLTRRDHPNPMLVGEVGTGRSALVRKLAQALSQKTVPTPLKRLDGRGKFLKQIKLADLLAKPAHERGKAIKEILEEAKTRKNEILLVLEDLPGGKETYTDDLLTVLFSTLGENTLSVLTTATPDVVKQLDTKGLTHTVQKIEIQPMDAPATLTTLRALRESLEAFHGVEIRDDALQAAAEKTKKYIPGVANPLSAYTIVDLTAARIQNQQNGMDRTYLKTQNAIYLAQLNQTQGLEKRIQEYQADLAQLQEKRNQLSTALLGEKATDLDAATALHNAISQSILRQETETGQALLAQYRKQDATTLEALLKVAQQIALKQHELEMTSKQQKTALQEARNLEEKLIQQKVLPVVTVENILETISERSNIPMSKLTEDEHEKLRHLQERLQERVVGQEQAVAAVTGAIQKSRLGIGNVDKPIASFLFLGPTGVGKTELAKATAEAVFDDPKRMIRLDMSEYMEAHSVSKLVGSPPGYVGHDDGGQLTEMVKKNPYSVLLFDELEKAHPDIFNILLQILDDGRLTDSKGNTVDFTNTIIMMTSNKGTARLTQLLKGINAKLDPNSRRFKEIQANMKVIMEQAIKEGAKWQPQPATLREIDRPFKPEFLNRIDDIIIFHPLLEDHVRRIVPIKIAQLNRDLAGNQNQIQVTVTGEGIDYLAENGVNTQMGARPLNRLIEKVIKTAISHGLINQTIKPGQTLELTKALLSGWAKEYANL